MRLDSRSFGKIFVQHLWYTLQVYTGGIENVIRAWDMRRNAVIFTMTGHRDTITSLRVSPDSGGDYLLSNAMVSLHIQNMGY